MEKNRAVRGPGLYHTLPVSPLAEDTKYNKSTTGGGIVGSQFTAGAQMITWNVFLGFKLKLGPVPSSQANVSAWEPSPCAWLSSEGAQGATSVESGPI